MAFSAPVQLLPLRLESGVINFFVDRRRVCSITKHTKANGDTDGTVDTYLRYVKKVVVLKSDGTEDTGAVATTGYGATGANFSTVLSSLAAGTVIYVIAIGGRN